MRSHTFTLHVTGWGLACQTPTDHAQRHPAASCETMRHDNTSARHTHPVCPDRDAQLPCRYDPRDQRGDEGEEPKRARHNEHPGKQRPLIRHRRQVGASRCVVPARTGKISRVSPRNLMVCIGTTHCLYSLHQQQGLRPRALRGNRQSAPIEVPSLDRKADLLGRDFGSTFDDTRQPRRYEAARQPKHGDGTAPVSQPQGQED